MVRKFTDEDDALLAELGVAAEPKKAASRTPREERIIAGFEEIQQFVETHGRAPRHGEDGDIFERLYAVRLDRIRELDDCHDLLSPFDHQNLLSHSPEAASPSFESMDDDTLLAELGVEDASSDIYELRHVRSSAEKRAAEETATRSKCKDFETFRPLFEQVQKDLDAGLRETLPLGIQADIEPGRFFIIGGQKAYVAEMKEEFTHRYGDKDARLRVIFDNGTESNMLRRSLQRALHKDEKGRRILEASAGPLFAGAAVDGDEASGTIYVLRSKANIPFVAENREILHKIGVTTSNVESRIASARLDPTYLMAEVEIANSYQLYNIGRGKFERLIHRIFDSARLDIQIEDRFGNPVRPREWFLVPLHVIDEAIQRIMDGTITKYTYDTKKAALVKQ